MEEKEKNTEEDSLNDTGLDFSDGEKSDTEIQSLFDLSGDDELQPSEETVTTQENLPEDIEVSNSDSSLQNNLEEVQETTQEEIKEEVQEDINTENEIDNIEDISLNDSVSNELQAQEELTDDPIEKSVEDASVSTEKNNKNIKIAPILADSDEFEEPIKELITVRPVKFQQFEETEPIRAIKKNLDIMQDVSMHVSVELGRTKTSIREVMEMETGSIVELDKIAGEQVEIFVNEKLVAKGEVIVIEDKFGVRVTSTSLSSPNNNY